MDYVMLEAPETKKRPTGIVILAVLWALSAIWNIYISFNAVIADLEILPRLSDPILHPWFRFGVPAEMLIGFLVLVFGLLQLLVVYGLYTAKPWSYSYALALPIIILVINLASVWLYSSAPMVDVRAAASATVPTIVGNFVWIAITWGYLRQRHVKQYLHQIPPSTSPPSAFPRIAPISRVKEAQEERKFCRYCGTENKKDAVFCEKCGKQIS